ncbi:PEP-CTERM sorting domain-containing protein [Marinobacter sp. V034]|uniref:PEP-CTERM sorting domain-containing protein n=1 Tax=Marinobacter sp. V034 TaxID=3459610 RepID=UPI0040440FA5
MKYRYCSAALLLFSVPSYASTIDYSGIITSASGNIGSSSYFDKVEEGDIVVGSFNYDPSGVDDINDWDVVGQYMFTEINSSFSLSILDSSNSNSVLYNYSGYISMILTENNWEYTPKPGMYPVIDSYTVTGRLENGAEVVAGFQNRDVDLGLITSDELPDYPMSFEDYNYTFGSIQLPGIFGQFNYKPDSLSSEIASQVPEPSSIALIGIGGAFLVFRRRKN